MLTVKASYLGGTSGFEEAHESFRKALSSLNHLLHFFVIVDAQNDVHVSIQRPLKFYSNPMIKDLATACLIPFHDVFHDQLLFDHITPSS